MIMSVYVSYCYWMIQLNNLVLHLPLEEFWMPTEVLGFDLVQVKVIYFL